MLKQTLISINKNIDTLIEITKQDIEDIKNANHNALFERNREKDKIVQMFITQKNQIDTILIKRNESGLTLENMLNEEESKLFDEFKIKLEEFHQLHKKFSKMALLITNFYNNLVNKVNQNEVDIGYEMKNRSYSSNLSLKA
ncbi:MAG: hypothetical protein DSY40_04305 [Nautilia sp.]|nr:MAG: hypothetical protein DSY40_04305 [Nautilia sp.]